MLFAKTRNAEAFCALRAGLFLGKGGIDLFVHLKRLRGAFRTRNSLFFVHFAHGAFRTRNTHVVCANHEVLLKRGTLFLIVHFTQCFKNEKYNIFFAHFARCFPAQQRLLSLFVYFTR